MLTDIGCVHPQMLNRLCYFPSEGWFDGAWASYDETGDGYLDAAEVAKLLKAVRKLCTPMRPEEALAVRIR